MIETLINVLEVIVKLIFNVLNSGITWFIVGGLLSLFLIISGIVNFIIIIVDTIRYGFKTKKNVKETIIGIVSCLGIIIGGFFIWKIVSIIIF